MKFSYVIIATISIPAVAYFLSCFSLKKTIKNIKEKKNKRKAENIKENNVCLSKIEKGSLGEKIIAKKLTMLDPKEYKVINNFLLLFKNGTSVQIDHLVISRSGIFVIETKNFSGAVDKLNDDWWIQTTDRNKCYKFYSPVKQNFGHIKTLENIFNNDSKDLFHSIVVFPDTTHIETTDRRVTHFSNIICEIEKFDKHILNYNKMNELYETLRTYNMNNDSNQQKHIDRLSASGIC